MVVELNMWNTAQFDDITEPESPITYGVVKPGEEGDVPFIRGGDIAGGRVLVDQLRTINREVSRQYRRTLLRGGEILVSLVGNPGQVAIAPHALAGANIARQVGLVRLREGVDARFICYFLQSPDGQIALGAQSLGSVQQVINLRDLKTVKVPLPPLAEQKAIASILGTLDDKIELNRRMNATLEAMARALFQSWFVDFDPVRAKLDGRPPTSLDPATAALFPNSFQDSPLGPIPKGWKAGPLAEHVEVVKGRSYRSEELAESKTALVTLKSFLRGGGYRADGLKPFTGEYKPNQRVCPGDLVVAFTDVTQAADVIGKPALIQSDERFDTLVASLDVGIIRRKSQHVSIPFVYCLFLTAEFQAHTYSHATGTTVLHLGSTAIPSFVSVVPPVEIAERFAERAEPIFHLIDENTKQSRTLATLRDTLLPRLLSGELSVSELSTIAP